MLVAINRKGINTRIHLPAIGHKTSVVSRDLGWINLHVTWQEMSYYQI